MLKTAIIPSKLESQLSGPVFLCVAIVLQVLLSNFRIPQEVGIFQANQIKLNDQDHTIDEYLNLGDSCGMTNLEFSMDFPSENKPAITAFYTDPFELDEEQKPQELEPPSKQKRQKLQQNSQALNAQYYMLLRLNESALFHQSYGSDYFQDFVKKSEMLFQNAWKQVFKMKPAVKVAYASQNRHKFYISKSESWEVHLKSIRTHFMQKIFYKLWKVPTQGVLKSHCFAGPGSRQQKLQIREYLRAELSSLYQFYDSFPKKREIYEQIIQRIMKAVSLAIETEGQLDDLIFEVLFKGQIAELFY